MDYVKTPHEIRYLRAPHELYNYIHVSISIDDGCPETLDELDEFMSGRQEEEAGVRYGNLLPKGCTYQLFVLNGQAVTAQELEHIIELRASTAP